MHAVLSFIARLTSDRPRSVLAALAVITVVLGGFAGNQRTDTELTAFATDSELAAGLERVQDEFAAGGSSLQVIVDAGAGGNVLSEDGIRAALAVEQAVDGSGVDFGDEDATVQSYGSVVSAALAAGDLDVDSASPAEIEAAAAVVMETEAAQLVSSDLDDGQARAGLVVVTFPAAMSDDRVADASLELAEVVDAVDVSGVTVSSFNAAVMGDALQAEAEQEMPRLLGLSMLLILGILLFQYRTVSDVLIGLVGLVTSIVWMTGFAVLLGPGYLGLVGPFSQMAMMVPVLLVGLGIDYAIHLTSRYREEQSHGQRPAHSASMAVRTVGGALVLATLTTMVGFLTNLFSPLPPIADFGVFTAVGVLGAFVVMTTLVPAARNLLDSRTRARRRTSRSPRPASGLSAIISRTAVVAQRVPRVALGVALVLSVAAAGAASQVDTTFSQDDFVPEDSDIGQLIDLTESLFGGGLTETTFALMDGDLTDPAIANAQLEVTERLADTPGVRMAAGSAQVSSPAGLVASLADSDPSLAEQAAQLGYDPTDGFAADADVAGLYELARTVAPAQATQVIDEAGTAGVIAVDTTVGQNGADALVDDLRADLAPLEAAGVDLSITSEPLVIDESLDALTDSQTQGIVITLVAALLLLTAYYGFKERKPLLGVITMVPSIAVVSWVLGTMWMLGISFNVMTAMVASLGIGIGVPFGIHVTHRFLEDRRRYDTIDEAIGQTVTYTGGAMAGSAATTAAGFGVLVLAQLTPMQQFGIIVAITIVYSFIAAILVQPACLKLWGEHRARRGDAATPFEHELRRTDDSPRRDEAEDSAPRARVRQVA
jgi:uncharacterized protein